MRILSFVPGQPWSRRWLVVGVIASLLALTIWAVFGAPRHFARPFVVPIPNGYDDLVQAGAMIGGPWPDGGDWRGPDRAGWRVFLAANPGVLKRTRLGLSRAGLANFADTQAGLATQLDQQSHIRSLSRFLLAAARMAQEEGRFPDAARLDLELLEVGQMTTQGSLAVAATVGWVIQEQALHQLRGLRDPLPPAQVRQIIARLERLDEQRTPIQALVDRWERWVDGAFPWWQQVPMRWWGVFAKGRAEQTLMVAKVRARVERAMRFVIPEWAIHLHQQETGRWPRSLAELVPAILTSVPVDPATNRPVAYPVNRSGELTDDLSIFGPTDASATTQPRP